MDGAGKKTTTKKTVCVTGAGGFIASWLVQRLLSTGDYLVHATVRDPSDPKNAHLKALDGAGERLRLFKADLLDYGIMAAAVAGERLRLFKADLLDYGSMAAAVAGCDGVFHVASPVPAAQPKNPDVEVLTPAVAGTQNVLKACREAKVAGRVVVVSSAAAVIMNPDFPKGAVLDEDSWSHEDYCRTTKMWYCLSKTLAEREALAYADKTGLDVVTVCPPLVLGPLLQSTVNTSSSILINLLKGDRDTADDKKRNLVDVRDVADALVLAYENPEASGRYICSAYEIKMSEMVGIVRGLYPSLNYPNKFVQVEDDKMMSSKKLQMLGWKFRTVEECLRDSVESYKAAGILK